jgi:hypothetical protein
MRAVWTAVLISLGCFAILSAQASKRAKNLDIDEVATTWIGISTGESKSYRLELELGGKGRGALLHGDRSTTVFSIASWSYDRGKIEISSEPIEIGDLEYSRRFGGSVTGTGMSLVDKGDDWKIEIEMRREAEVLGRWNRLRSAMDRSEIGNVSSRELEFRR